MTLFDRLVLTAWSLNAFDAVITVYATTIPGVTELNPLMDLCLAISPGLFLLVKIGVMTAVCVAFRRQKRCGRTLWGVLWVALAVLVAICVWNAYSVIRLAAG